jgi:outer membrane protein OmpA-like peptidoglycan-associated protein
MKTIHWISLTLALFTDFNPGLAQNLIANSSFEDVNICYEFNARCAPEAWFAIPATPFRPNPGGKYPMPLHGDSYAQIVMEHFEHPISHRVYIYTSLLCPLKKDSLYTLEFYLNPARKEHFKLGIVLTPDRVQLSTYLLDGNAPTLLLGTANSVNLHDDGWHKVTTTYKASGGEQYLTFGNFDSRKWRPEPSDNRRIEIKYLVDDVKLFGQPGNPICPDYDERREKLYAHDFRHTDTIVTYKPEPLSITVQDSLSEDEEVYDDVPEDMVDEMVDDVEIPAIAPAFVIPDIGFAFGKHQLAAQADSLLAVCAAQIRLKKPTAVTIKGFTDDIGSESFNLELSAKRAEAVRDWMIEKAGLSPAIFQVEGLGEQQPVAPNDTEVGRQANRRVEIFLNE